MRTLLPDDSDKLLKDFGIEKKTGCFTNAEQNTQPADTNARTLEYEYDIIDCNTSSRTLGGCEVCGKYCNDTFHQIKRKGTQHLSDVFGHYNCLISIRR